MATGKYPRQPFADEGLPQDWGEPEEMPEVNDYLGPAPWRFGNWRFVVVELTADERVMLTKLCLLYTSPSPRDRTRSRMPSSA